MTPPAGRVVAAITGAGSGIGRALAVELARRGADLALSDIDADGLATTRTQAEATGASVHTAVADVADRAAVAAWARDVVGHFGVVHQLYNNAGVAFRGGRVLDSDDDAIEQTLQINLWGVIHGTKEFLPHLIASGAGALVNVSSLNGLLAQPGLAPYCASKFAVRGFTEAVRAEMLADGHPVFVAVVHPGGVKTNIATAALEAARRAGSTVTPEQEARTRFYNERFFRTSAPAAARIILDGVQARRPRILVGPDARFVDVATRLAPRFALRRTVTVERLMRRGWSS